MSASHISSTTSAEGRATAASTGKGGKKKSALKNPDASAGQATNSRSTRENFSVVVREPFNNSSGSADGSGQPHRGQDFDDEGMDGPASALASTENMPLSPAGAHQSLYRPPDPSMVSNSFWRQLLATLRRQLIQKRRGWVITFLEILLPSVFVLILVIVNYVSPPSFNDADSFKSENPTDKPRSLSIMRQMACYNGETAPELMMLIPPCSVVNSEVKCAEAGILPVDNFCIIGGDKTILEFCATISQFSEEFEVPNLDDLILMKWMVKALVPPSMVFWDLGTTFASLQNYGNIFLIPENSQTQMMRNVFHNRFLLFKYVWGGFYESRDAILPFVKDIANEGKTWAAIEVKELNQRNLDFIIMTNRSGVPWMHLGPREMYPMGLGTQAYSAFFSNGFFTMQKSVNDYYVHDYLGINATDIEPAKGTPTRLSMVPMGILRHKYSSFLALSLLVGPFVLVLAFLFPISQLSKRLVEEKEQRLREGTMIMGLTRTAFFSSWLIVYYVQMFLAALLVSFVQKVAITTETNFGIIFFMYLLFVIATINMSAMLSTFFSRAKIAALVVPLIYFVVSVPAFAIPDGTHPAVYQALSIFCPTPLAVALRLQFGYEVNRGIGWQDFSNELDIPYNFAKALIWIVCDGVAYLILMVYLDMVLPKEWGTTYHPLFFIMPASKGGIWNIFCCKRIGRRQRGDEEDGHEMSNDPDAVDNPSNYFTEEARSDTHHHRAVQDYPMPNSESTVHINGLRKQFGDGAAANVAVENMQLRMFPDGITVLLGHNGAGKTTVMNMITGMMPPTGGDVTIYGKSILNDMQGIRRDIGFCPQHNILWDELTCMEHLEYFARLKGLPADEVKAEAEEMLQRVDLFEKRDVLSANLSGGQKRKLSVAIAFIGRARLVLLDEPTAGMDVAARRHTWDVLKDMSAGRTILLTTHYMDEADLLGSNIAIMSKGSLHSYGTPMYLKNNLGTGYVMRIALDHAITDATPILAELQTIIPGAAIKEAKGQEVSFSLPKDATKKFPDAIRHLEAIPITQKYGIVSVSMSVSTLEDVFLGIAHEEALNGRTEEEYESGEMCEREEAFQALEECYIALQKQNQIITHQSIAQHSLANESTDNAKLDNARSLTPAQQLRRQFVGMLMKRFNHARRDYFALFIQIVSPIFCIVVAMCLSMLNLPTSPLHYMENSEYGDRKQLLVTNNCENLDPYWSKSFDKVEEFDFSPTGELQDYLLESYDDHGGYERFIAYDCNNSLGNNVMIVNATSLQAAPQALNELYQARARYAIGDPSIRLRVASHPFPFSEREEAQVSGIKALLASLFVLIPFTFIPSVYASYVVRERECKSKHLQFVSGANFVIYWMANILFDLCAFILTTGIAFIIFACFQRDEYIGDGRIFGATFLLFMLYGLSSLGMAYFIGHFFTNHSSAQTVTLLTCFLSGFTLVVLIFFLENTNASTQRGAEVLVFFFRFIPPFCLGDGLKNLALNHSMDTYTGGINPFAMDTTGWNMIFMAAEAVIFFVLAIFIDHPKHNEKKQMLQQRSDLTAPPIPFEDEDVARERFEVEGGERDDDVVQVQGLRKVFALGGRKLKVAVQNITFGVKPGEVFGFLGTNGAGKTTTMSMLTTEIIPTCGNGRVGGFDIVKQSEETRKLIGYCPQFDAIMDLLTPDEHLHLFAALRGIPTSTTNEVVDALIKTCALEKYRSVPSGRLSGGNKRKLSVAMALIGGPSIVFLDEPSAGMDPHARRQLWDVISFVAKHSSVLLTTHHLEEVEVLAHRVGIMDQGLMRCLGPLEHLKRKFGNGYELTIQVDSIEGAEAAVEFLFNQYPDAVLVEARQQRMLFTLPFDSTDLASLFQTIQQASEDPATGIIDYVVQQTSLEQVFMRISAMKEAEDEEDAGAEPSVDEDGEMPSSIGDDYNSPTRHPVQPVGAPDGGFHLPYDPNDPVWQGDEPARNDASGRSKFAASAMYMGSVFNPAGMASQSQAMRQSQYRSVSAALYASMNFDGARNGPAGAGASRSVSAGMRKRAAASNAGQSFASMS